MPPQDQTNQIPIVPPPVQTQVSEPSKQRLHPLVILAIVIVLCCLGYIGFRLFSHSGGASEERFSLYENGAVVWYSLNGTTVTSAIGPTGFDTMSPKILEATQPLKSEDVIVLAQAGSGEKTETQLGVIRDKSFLSLLTLTKNDTNPKADLIARNDGTIVFAEATSSSNSSWNLYSLSLYATPQVFLAIGPGFDPAFSSTTSGAVLAIAPEGLVRIDPSGNGRSTLIARANVPPGEGAVSPDALLTLLPNSVTKTFDLFSIDPRYATQVSYLSSIKEASTTAVSFISPNTFIGKGTGNNFTEYEVVNGKITSSALTYKSS